ncbi:YozQ family protein [Neobacillus niacini]|uniref:YozQ family protein n=1 Tax=Neobacillus niacini TaxID=86668 RepID=UPI0021CB2F16|nr:YozQ family protein [Neobacillus niacini]MCM3765921.1 YozQ family protein [Neobacillus niacini]
MEKNEPKKGNEVAGSIYHTSDYQSNDPLSQGLATTHEQVSDAYMEGEIGAVIDDVDGKDIPIPRKGFEEE